MEDTIIGLGIVIGIAVFGFALVFILAIRASSPKYMEKKLTKMGEAAVRAQNNIMKNNKDIYVETASAAAEIQNKVINQNEEMLKDTADRTAEIHKDAFKTIVHSVKEGLTEDSKIYCKYCGAQIDTDSKFCKKCGKEQ